MDLFQTVLVPVDFSDRSVAALLTATQLAGVDGSVHAVHVLPPLAANEPGVLWGAVSDDSRISHATDALTDLLGGLGMNTANTHVVVGKGNPAYAVTDLGVTLDANLIIVPSTGKTGLSALGSVAERIVRFAKRPVLVLHP